MNSLLFEFTDYRTYLDEWLRSQPAGGYGQRSKWAEAMGCKSAYVSRVLQGGAELSLEQGEKLSEHLAHTRDEKDYFILLVSLARAATASLRSYYLERVQEFSRNKLILKNRSLPRQPMAVEQQATYYSSWQFAAIHVLLMIPAFRTPKAIGGKLKIPLPRVLEVLEFLVRIGAAQKTGDRFKADQVTLYLPSDSSLIAQHQSNWRVKCLQSLENFSDRDFHYSAAISLNQKDVPKVRAILVSAFEQIRKTVRASENEDEILGYCLDLFHL